VLWDDNIGANPRYSIARRMWGSRTGVWWNLPRNLGYRLALGRYPEVGWDPGLEGRARSAGSAPDR
jgi:hypothetical protein